MYVAPTSIDRGTLYQGDILKDFSFFLFENGLPIKRNDARTFIEDVPPEGGEAALFAFEVKKRRIMILSQTCDVQRRNNVIICPVYALEDFVTDNTLNLDTVKSIRKRKINYLFYLPAFEDLPESIADLQTMLYVPRSLIEKCVGQKEIMLSDLGRHHLGWTLATFFGRPAED